MRNHLAIVAAALLTPALCIKVANAQTVITTAPAAPAPATVVETAPPPPQQTTVVAAAPATRETAVVSSGPNAMLLKSGIFVFGIPYGTSVVVGATSSRDEDKDLFIPVVGPWIDFGSRHSCGSIGNPSCDGETAVKVALAADGIFQAIGAIEIISAFMVHDSTAVVASKDADKPRVMMAPSRVGGTGYGVAAVGTF
ncbi:MAG TPA: hypothetical protein VGL13_12235 [Polyangiaceae bacterium]|jgi:hypothetical protein